MRNALTNSVAIEVPAEIQLVGWRGQFAWPYAMLGRSCWQQLVVERDKSSRENDSRYWRTAPAALVGV
jgi:hypothetical protein